ncbi:hypothetical protein [Flavobacterium wongokense]|uniref:hypothetical protein n=1 Tax=Flavobacterium wongokense TaxID=2910674 RepID=UPI001F408EAF|nr:hypothetical protein [Flavobacterium sp. WG47]MCF6132226.1 hypothetical protein [Flavobacterium sp. WG47]
MGIFDKLFGKKTENKPQEEKKDLFMEALYQEDDEATDEVFTVAADKDIVIADTIGYEIVRPLTDAQREAVYNSTIYISNGQLYMHYYTDGLKEDRDNPEWQNKVLFFWTAEEEFPKKSLPAAFETYKHKHFIFSGDTEGIQLQVGKAIPWFGMPGEGKKHACLIDGKMVSIPELNKMGLVDYIEMVELTDSNLNILTNQEEYYLLVDERITPYEDGNFYLNGRSVPIDVAYSVGGIHIIKMTTLE